MDDRRTKLRRQRDQEMEDKMLALEAALQEHLTDCAENAKAVRVMLENYHTQNIKRFEGLEKAQAKNQSLSQESLDIINAIATGKRATVGMGRFVIWIASVFAAVIGIITGVGWLKSH